MSSFFYILLLVTVPVLMAQDSDVQNELDAARVEMEIVDNRLDSLTRSLQERLNVTGDDNAQLTSEIIRISEELDELYSRSDEEITTNQERITELKERLKTYEGKLQMAQQEELQPVDEESVRVDMLDNIDAAPDDAYPDASEEDELSDIWESEEISDDEDEYLESSDSNEMHSDYQESDAFFEPEVAKEDSTERITRFRIIGNDNLEENILKRSLAIGEGTPYDVLRVRFSKIKLAYLRSLYHYRFIVRPDSTPDSMDVTLRVSDMTGIWANSYDFSLRKVPEIIAGKFSLSYHNIGARARRLTCVTAWDWQRLSARKAIELSYTIPYQFEIPFLWEWYVFDDKITRYTGVFEFDDMTELKYGGGLRWFHYPALWLKINAGAEYRQRTFNRLYRPTDKDGNMATLWTQWAASTQELFDTDQVNFSGSLKFSYHMYHEMGGVDSIGHYGLFDGQLRVWTEFIPGVTVGTEMRYGVSSPDMPVDFLFSGGSKTILRGHPRFWRMGTCYAHNSTELSYALHKNISLAIFTDIGMVWPRFADIERTEIVWDVGAGLGLTVPYVGSGRVNVAFNPATETWYMYLHY